MKFGKVVKTLIKIAPIVYPIVKDVLNSRKATKNNTSHHNKYYN